MANRVLLVRHGETDEQYKGRFVGSTDLPMSDIGTIQAARLARFVARAHPGKCFSSPMKRAFDTACEAGIVDPELDDDFREIDFGLWEGLTFDEIQTKYPELVDDWAAFLPGFSFPEGESIEEFLIRIRRAGDKIAACREESVLVVSHAGVIRALICYFLGLSPRNYVLFDIKPASVTTIDLFDGKGVLTGLNDPG